MHWPQMGRLIPRCTILVEVYSLGLGLADGSVLKRVGSCGLADCGELRVIWTG